jgi:hypothetical protein
MNTEVRTASDVLGLLLTALSRNLLAIGASLYGLLRVVTIIKWRLGTFDSAKTSIKVSAPFKGTNLNSISLLALMIPWCTCVVSIQDTTKFVFDEVCSSIRSLA